MGKEERSVLRGFRTGYCAVPPMSYMQAKWGAAFLEVVNGGCLINAHKTQRDMNARRGAYQLRMET